GELNDALDAMAAAAGHDPDLASGLVAIEADHWIQVLSAVRAGSGLHDGLRHREIVIHVGSQQETEVLARGEAGERGAPFARRLDQRPVRFFSPPSPSARFRKEVRLYAYLQPAGSASDGDGMRGLPRRRRVRAALLEGSPTHRGYRAADDRPARGPG